jgi:hypothetical protein
MLLVVKANENLPALTCQDVGRELYHKRYDVAQIIGPSHTLQKIAWIFERASDMFELQFQYASLVVRRARAQATLVEKKKESLTTPVRNIAPILESSLS